MAEATESKKSDPLNGKTPETGTPDGENDSGENALDGFVKDAHSWFEEEVLQAKLDKEKEAEEATRRAEEAAKAAEEAKAKAEAELKAQLEKERKAREQAEAEAKAKAKQSAEAEKAKKEDKAAAKPAPAAASAPAEAAPAAPASKNGLYFLIGSAIIGVAVIVLAFRMGGDDDKDRGGAARQGPMATGAMTEEPRRAEPVRAEPMRTEPVRTEPLRTEPLRPRPDTPKIGGLQCLDKKVFVGRIQVGPEPKLDTTKPLHARCGKGICKARACFAKAEGDPEKTVLSAEIIEPADLAASKVFPKATCQQDQTAGTLMCERPQQDQAPFVRFDTRPADAAGMAPDRAAPDRAAPDRAAPDRAAPDRAAPDRRPRRVTPRRRIRRPGMRRRYVPRRRRPMRRGMGMGWDNPFG